MPPGHYRATVEARGERPRWDQEPPTFSARTDDFYVAQNVGGGFQRVIDAHVDNGGRLIVPDADQNNIRIFGADGQLQATLTPPLNAPKDVAVSPDDSEIYVANSGHRQVTVVDRQGNLKRAWGGGGTGPGQFSANQGPQGIAVTPLNGGRVYVADGDLPRVQAFDFSGILMQTITGGDLNDPFSPSVAPDGSVWVADAGTNRVIHFSSAGAQLQSFPLRRPFGVDVDRNGRVIYADNTDRFGGVLDPGGGIQTAVGQSFLGGPSGMAAAGLAGDFYVVDGAADQVFRFRVP